MELNREQIIKALECCIKAESWGDCEELGCPAHTKQGCYFYLRTDDDYENTIYIELCKDALSLIKELTEENDRLKELGTTKEIEKEIVRRQTKADIVRKMQTMFEMRFGTYTDKDMTPITDVFMLLDQIANEIIQGELKCH